MEHAMQTESVNSSDVAAALTALRQEVARLSERVAALERTAGSAGPAVAAAPARPTAAAPSAEGISEEIVLVIAAAVAAFLGKKAPIRQIRLLGSAAWAQQGRVIIQASHNR
jgi:methylmalonyl-CoA carboxyltransferase large subunit